MLEYNVTPTMVPWASPGMSSDCRRSPSKTHAIMSQRTMAALLPIFASVASASLIVPSSDQQSRRSVLVTSSSLAAAAVVPPGFFASAATAADYRTQPGLKLNTGQNFPIASFGLQVYNDETAEKLTLLALEVRRPCHLDMPAPCSSIESSLSCHV